MAEEDKSLSLSIFVTGELLQNNTTTARVFLAVKNQLDF
jgi:hypothetical protein